MPVPSPEISPLDLDSPDGSAVAVASAAAHYMSSSRPHPEVGGHRISEEFLLSLTNSECLYRFRFTAQELIYLTDVMEVPDIVTRSGYRAPPIECLGLLCARLRSAEDQWSLAMKYGRPQSAISQIVNETATYLNNHWTHLLDWDFEGIVSPDRLRVYADAISVNGGPATSIFGFIDCAIRQTCRPSIGQEHVYTGYKKYHRMKFQAVALPNGLLGHLAGPYRAPQNDMGVLSESGLIEKLSRYAIQPGSTEDDPAGRRYFQLYGDSAYCVSPVMVSPFSGIQEPTPEQRKWNSAMGAVRISVEHAFGLVLQDWPFLRAFWKHKILQNPVGVHYRIGALLTNAYACIIPNQTSRKYGVRPPSLEEYFRSPLV